MKLRTVCEDGHVSGFSADHERDAAYAHALVMAMNEFRKAQSWSPKFPAIWQLEVTERANELMAEWGYTED